MVLHKGYNDSNVPRQNKTYQNKDQSYKGKVVVHFSTKLCMMAVMHTFQASVQVSRSNLERLPSSRGAHCHAARLLSRESSKAPLGCHSYGDKVVDSDLNYMPWERYA